MDEASRARLESESVQLVQEFLRGLIKKLDDTRDTFFLEMGQHDALGEELEPVDLLNIWRDRMRSVLDETRKIALVSLEDETTVGHSQSGELVGVKLRWLAGSPIPYFRQMGESAAGRWIAEKFYRYGYGHEWDFSAPEGPRSFNTLIAGFEERILGRIGGTLNKYQVRYISLEIHAALQMQEDARDLAMYVLGGRISDKDFQIRFWGRGGFYRKIWDPPRTYFYDDWVEKLAPELGSVIKDAVGEIEEMSVKTLGFGVASERPSLRGVIPNVAAVRPSAVRPLRLTAPDGRSGEAISESEIAAPLRGTLARNDTFGFGVAGVTKALKDAKRGVHNFSAGPGKLPLPVLEEVQRDMLNYRGSGMSVMEMSHRGEWIDRVFDDAEARIRKVMGVPDDYAVLFLQGGASQQFGMVPKNLYIKGKPVDFIDTGYWTDKAIAETKRVLRRRGKVRILTSWKKSGYTRLPRVADIKINRNASYVQMATNNTIMGTQWRQKFPNMPKGVALVADMSSDFASRRIRIRDFDLIFASAQKNLGPAGVTVVIIKKELADRASKHLPVMDRYKTHIVKGSRYNTPPVFSVYMVGLVMKWIARQRVTNANGVMVKGLKAVEARNEKKAKLLYDVIDGSSFYEAPAAKRDRSRMNVVFRINAKNGKKLEKKFVKEAKAAGLIGLGGHRDVGGLRASIYNAVTIKDVRALIAFMKKFERDHTAGFGVASERPSLRDIEPGARYDTGERGFGAVRIDGRTTRLLPDGALAFDLSSIRERVPGLRRASELVTPDGLFTLPLRFASHFIGGEGVTEEQVFRSALLVNEDVTAHVVDVTYPAELAALMMKLLGEVDVDVQQNRLAQAVRILDAESTLASRRLGLTDEVLPGIWIFGGGSTIGPDLALLESTLDLMAPGSILVVAGDAHPEFEARVSRYQREKIGKKAIHLIRFPTVTGEVDLRQILTGLRRNRDVRKLAITRGISLKNIGQLAALIFADPEILVSRGELTKFALAVRFNGEALSRQYGEYVGKYAALLKELMPILSLTDASHREALISRLGYLQSTQGQNFMDFVFETYARVHMQRITREMIESAA